MSSKNLYLLTHISAKFIYYTLALTEDIGRRRLREQLDRPVTSKASEERKRTLQKLKEANVFKSGKAQYLHSEWIAQLIKENATVNDYDSVVNYAGSLDSPAPHLVNNPTTTLLCFGNKQ